MRGLLRRPEMSCRSKIAECTSNHVRAYETPMRHLVHDGTTSLLFRVSHTVAAIGLTALDYGKLSFPVVPHSPIRL